MLIRGCLGGVGAHLNNAVDSNTLQEPPKAAGHLLWCWLNPDPSHPPMTLPLRLCPLALARQRASAVRGLLLTRAHK